MSIVPINSLNTVPNAVPTSTTPTSSQVAAATQVSFVQYLQLLTAQMKNQDPSNPTDPNQFTQEMIQIQQVEQQNNTNTDLENLTKATSANSLAAGVGYIGNYVQANSTGGDFSLQGGSAEFGYSLASASHSTTITIKDDSGKTVATLNGATASGGNYVSWDGKDNNGKQLPDGAYTFAVAAADIGGNAITSSNSVALFKVSSVQSNTDGTLELLSGDLALSTGDVTSVFMPSTLPTATALTVPSSSSS
jgi:flagellar basal-body rod modification protein FlgD